MPRFGAREPILNGNDKNTEQMPPAEHSDLSCGDDAVANKIAAETNRQKRTR
jgi:hypothetical protein